MGKPKKRVRKKSPPETQRRQEGEARWDPDQWPGGTTPDWDEVDEASWQSFPASDPPAYIPQRLGR